MRRSFYFVLSLLVILGLANLAYDTGARFAKGLAVSASDATGVRRDNDAMERGEKGTTKPRTERRKHDDAAILAHSPSVLGNPRLLELYRQELIDAFEHGLEAVFRDGLDSERAIADAMRLIGRAVHEPETIDGATLRRAREIRNELLRDEHQPAVHQGPGGEEELRRPIFRWIVGMFDRMEGLPNLYGRRRKGG